MSRERKIVVAGLIVENCAQRPSGRILLTQRRPDQLHPNQWELPGGKVEPGEHPEQALRRELAEEIGVEVQLGGVWEVVFHGYDSFDVLMVVYWCQLAANQIPTPVEVAAVRWVGRDELRNYAILQADVCLIDRLMRDGVPPPPRGMVV